VTGVTCPFFRYHPAIIAQAAATVALLSDGRFTLGIGAGERLNEHVVGRPFPAVRVRHEMLREALEIIRLLWQGGYQSYDGKHLQLEDARVFDLPETLPRMPVAAGGSAGGPARRRARRRAVRHRAAGRPRRGLHRAGGSGPLYCEAPLAWAPDEDTAAQALLETSRWALTGWKVMSELPNPVNFDAASATVRKGGRRPALRLRTRRRAPPRGRAAVRRRGLRPRRAHERRPDPTASSTSSPASSPSRCGR
jgi:G6PDH family F420-dependent oxidoreductase